MSESDPSELSDAPSTSPSSSSINESAGEHGSEASESQGERLVKRHKAEYTARRLVDDRVRDQYETRMKRWQKAAPTTVIFYNEHRSEQAASVSTSSSSIHIAGELYAPEILHSSLLPHQREGLNILWRWRSEGGGGIVADEMGLGKTVQTVAYVASLHHSRLLPRPSLVICPATLLRQWFQEFRLWWPALRVIVLHLGSVQSESEDSFTRLIRQNADVYITTYSTLQINAEELLGFKWDCVFLDEGHKIKNPDADITLKCKGLLKIILSGSPIQNNLIELWSLLDFVRPSLLGTQTAFEEYFNTPITLGGYSNATKLQVRFGMECVLALRNLIRPCIIKRTKDILDNFTRRTEHVIFCRLTSEQRHAYELYLSSDDIDKIMNKSLNALHGISMLRKICNHPDFSKPGAVPTVFETSGKVLVLVEMLARWQVAGDRVLVFSQSRRCLDMLQQVFKEHDWNHRRMDGTTLVETRIPLVDEFNSNADIFAFLLTTRVGGLGINLIGANRVVIFDPDWNPQVDIQACERIWRIGQHRDVVLYRLITSGTIEEKIMQRQIHKQLLSTSVLRRGAVRSGLASHTLKDLFSLPKETPRAVSKQPAALQESNEPRTEYSEDQAILDMLSSSASVREIHEHGTLLAANSRVSQQAERMASDAVDNLMRSVGRRIEDKVSGSNEYVRERVRKLLSQKGGKATSGEIVSEFQADSRVNIVDLRASLKQVAVFVKGGSGEGEWQLKYQVSHGSRHL